MRVFPLAVAVSALPLVLLSACDTTPRGGFDNLQPQGTWDRRDSVAVVVQPETGPARTFYVVFDQTLTLAGANTALSGTLTTTRRDTHPVSPPRPLDGATVTGTFDGYALKLTLTHPSRTVTWNGSVGITNEFVGFTDENRQQIAFLRRKS